LLYNKRIKMGNPLDYIKSERVVELAKKLISIPSTTNHEHILSDWYSEFFKELGLETRRLPVADSGDTIVSILEGPKDKPTMMLNFHIDTFDVFNNWETDPFTPTIKGDRLYGLGSHDMKGGAACALAAVEAIVKSGVKLGGRLIISGTTDEENWSRGAHELIKSGVLRGCEYCLVPEPNASGTLTIGERGRHVFHLKFHGHSVSAAYSGGVNAVVEAAKAVKAFSDIPPTELGWSDEFEMGGSLCVTGIQGGGTMIYVPELADVWVDRHILPGQTRDWAADQLRRVLATTGMSGQYELTWDERPTPAPTSFLVPKDGLLVQTVKAHMEREHEGPVKFVIARSVADTNHIAVHGGVPTLICGPSGGNTCEANEWVDIKSLVPTARVLCKSTLDLLGPG
jgi:succinyl-diaminopimelate desuccinylase